MSQTVIETRNLTKEFQRDEFHVIALKDANIEIQKGEFLTLMGPSGSGKSTLLHIIAGIDRPTNGECRVQDIDVTRLNESELADWRNQNVGFVFQTFNLIPVLTAFENVELPLLLMQLSSKQRRQLANTAHVGGNKRRVAGHPLEQRNGLCFRFGGKHEQVGGLESGARLRGAPLLSKPATAARTGRPPLPSLRGWLDQRRHRPGVLGRWPAHGSRW